MLILFFFSWNYSEARPRPWGMIHPRPKQTKQTTIEKPRVEPPQNASMSSFYPGGCLTQDLQALDVQKNICQENCYNCESRWCSNVYKTYGIKTLQYQTSY